MTAIEFFEQYIFWITAGMFFAGAVFGFVLGTAMGTSPTWQEDDEQPMRSEEYGE